VILKSSNEEPVQFERAMREARDVVDEIEDEQAHGKVRLFQHFGKMCWPAAA
jgi:hypothetical protein